MRLMTEKNRTYGAAIIHTHSVLYTLQTKTTPQNGFRDKLHSKKKLNPSSEIQEKIGCEKI